MRPVCSVVMPAFNEETGLADVVEAVVKALSAGEVQPFEIVLVDDGSTDATWEVIARLAKRHPEIRGLRFARNFGHQLAVHAGLKATAGEVVAVLDSDGQDPPELLPEMVRKIRRDGYDVVNCVRKKRKERAWKRAAYFLFYRLYRRLVPFELPVDSGDFSAMSRAVVDTIAGVSQHTPFLRGMRAWAGGRQVRLEYERQARQAGESKYGLVKLLVLAFDGITSFSKIPLRLSIVAGLGVSAGSIVYAVFVIVRKLTTDYPSSPEKQGWASLAFLVAFLGGLTLTVLGIIGEYLGHIFDAVRGMPPFLVRERLGFERADAAGRTPTARVAEPLSP